MNPTIEIKAQNTAISDDNPVHVGDNLEIRVMKNNSWGASIIEILDSNENRRFLSRRNGDHIFKTVIPNTNILGNWLCKINIEGRNSEDHHQFEKILSITDKQEVNGKISNDNNQSNRVETAETLSEPSSKEEVIDELGDTELVDEEVDDDIVPEHTESEENIMVTDDQSIIEKKEEVEETSYDEVTEAEKDIIETEIDDNEQVDEDYEETEIDSVSKTNEELATKVEEKVYVANEMKEELLPIDMSKLSLTEQKDKLLTISTKEELEVIQPFQLDQDDKNDLEIPIAEIDEIDKTHHNELKDADILYVYHLLETKPSYYLEYTSASVEDIKIWLERLYIVYNNPQHGLRKEYRRIRAEYTEYQRQLETKMESKKAQDPLSVLVGLNNKSIDRLNEEGVETVGRLLQIPLVDLINLGVDPEKPLLPKLWIANAKSHVGIR